MITAVNLHVNKAENQLSHITVPGLFITHLKQATLGKGRAWDDG